MQEPTYDRSVPNNFGDDIPFDGECQPAPAPRTGPGAFRAGDHVKSIASLGDKKRRAFRVKEINDDGTLHIWAHMHGHIYRADPNKWERGPRVEEMVL